MAARLAVGIAVGMALLIEGNPAPQVGIPAPDVTYVTPTGSSSASLRS